MSNSDSTASVRRASLGRICSICQETIPVSEGARTPCFHYFHRPCIERWLSTRDTCPVCRKTIPTNSLTTPTTSFLRPSSLDMSTDIQSQLDNLTIERGSRREDRAEARQARQELQTGNGPEIEIPSTSRQAALRSGASSGVSDHVDRHSIQAMVSEAVRASMVDVSAQLNESISRALRSSGDNRHSLHGADRDSSPESDHVRRSGGSARHVRKEYRQRPSTSPRRNRDPERTIRNWKLTFNGDSNGIPVRQFISRVNFLTETTLSGNTDELVQHAHMLFEGKALRWYYTYAPTADTLNWRSLCDHLCDKFRSRYDEDDALELLRSVKQRHNESCEAFVDRFVQYADTFDRTFPEHKLVKLMKRNLRPEFEEGILQEILDSVNDLLMACDRIEEFHTRKCKSSHQETRQFRPQRHPTSLLKLHPPNNPCPD